MSLAGSVLSSSAAAAVSSSSSAGGMPIKTSFRSEVTALWEMNGKQMEQWVRQRGDKLSPSALLGLPAAGSTSTTPKQQKQLHDYVHMTLWKNVRHALDSLQMVPIPPPKIEEPAPEPDEEPSAKRVKTNNNNKKKAATARRTPPTRYRRQDPFLLWLHVPLPQKDDDDEGLTGNEEYDLGEDEDVIPETVGGRVAQLGVAGFVNALACVQNGLVTTKNVSEPRDDATRSKVLLQIPVPSSLGQTQPIAITALQVHRVAVTWHRLIQAAVRQDILVTTPLRIQDMLAADLSAQEFASIRKRIYDTVILGKGIHTAADVAAAEQDETLATAQNAAAGAVLEIEKFKKCPTCHNKDQAAFVLDRKNGDVICSLCGTVVSESLLHEGSQYRKFEGEVDRNHHGDAANPLYSNAHNMSTTLSGVQPSSGAGIGGWRSGATGGGGRNLETILRNAHDYIELNVSQLGKTDRRTRVGYKDRQKKDAFKQMGHVGDALSLHEAVVQRAKELFAGFRDDRELVQQFKGVIAACLCEAFEQLSTAGQSIMKGDDNVAANNGTTTSSSSSSSSAPQSVSSGPDAAASSAAAASGYSARAARRAELHHAKLAGKGGLLLDFSNVATAQEPKTPSAPTTTTSSATPTKTESSPSAPAAAENALEETPAATWDLEHCRSWLLEASRRIAQQWVEERNQGKNPKIPATATLEELEGQLVEHSFTLCEQLEAELQSRSAKAAAAAPAAKRRVVTPRINDMAKLGIKWQHSHERGSGGKGGVGGSGNAAAALAHQRTAGQVLILKTAKKLGSMLKNPVAGDAIHKELRAVVAKQEARKLQDRRQEASRQRLQQMKRKPYLLARVQADS